MQTVFHFAKERLQPRVVSPGRNSTCEQKRPCLQLDSVIVGSLDLKLTEFHISNLVRPMDEDSGHDSLKSFVSMRVPANERNTHQVDTFANNILDLPVLPLPLGETLPF